MKHIIFDCDNTMGINGCDVDDGLALMYLTGKCREQGDLLEGITTTYGNSSLQVVYDSTAQLLKETGLESIPLLKGCSEPADVPIHNADARSEAGQFLAETAAEYPGQLSVLATGSMTNLLDAYQHDDQFFQNLDELVVMGAITEPLIINGRRLKELNFSCNIRAAGTMLERAEPLSIITGNNCLAAFFSHKEFKDQLVSPKGHYVYHKTKYWFEDNIEQFGTDGFYCWDVIAAIYLMEKRFFRDREQLFKADANDLKQGLIGDASQAALKANLPEIYDVEGLKKEFYQYMNK